MGEQGRDGTWLGAFLEELISMPRRHLLVFVLATVLLIVVEVEIEGWHVVHIAELVGLMVFLYLLWAAWRTQRPLRTRA
jgi:hypothetical protein